MAELTLVHTALIEPATLEAVRVMVAGAFGDDLGDRGWDNCLGGVHCIAWEGGDPVGHASVVTRRLLHAGRALRTGYVEGVAVAPDHRRRGIGGAVMEGAEGVIRDAYAIGALAATDEAIPLYRGRRWTEWEGTLSALTPDGIVPTPDERGGVFVLDPSGMLDAKGALTCDWRDGELW